ncbi:MAG: bacteriohemerythrin [Candidatus Falkowbacteria bacterium]
MSIINKQLVWEDKYSVGVEQIDNQHKKMFAVINDLVSAINSKPTEEKLSAIIKSLIEYKKFHFATEEKYFKEFNYDGAADHIAKHHEFSQKLEEIESKYVGDVVGLAFELVDFLEDWLIEHLMIIDQKYVPCFKAHGLK